jgi:hypothetical protein
MFNKWAWLRCSNNEKTPVVTRMPQLESLDGSPKDSRAKPLNKLTPIKRRSFHQPNRAQTRKPPLFPKCPVWHNENKIQIFPTWGWKESLYFPSGISLIKNNKVLVWIQGCGHSFVCRDAKEVEVEGTTCTNSRYFNKHMAYNPFCVTHTSCFCVYVWRMNMIKGIQLHGEK